MKTATRGALAAAILSAASAPGLAADLPSIKAPPPPPPVFVDTYQPFQVRLKVGAVVPTQGTASIFDAGAVYPGLPVGGSLGVATGLSGGFGTQVPGASTSISYSIQPMLDVAYYLTKNWAIEAICCVSHHHIQGINTLGGGDLGRTWVFPPSVMLQYHFTNFGAFQPYLGVGVNFTTFWGTRAGNNNWALGVVPGSMLGVGGALGAAGLVGVNASFYNLNITPSWGVVGQVGFDYMFNEHWGVNLDVKYIQMETGAQARIVAFSPQIPALGPLYIPVHGHVNIDPLVVSTGLTYRFGGGSAAPILAKY
jgi:outer membrane protein